MALDTFGDLKAFTALRRRDTGYEHWTEAQTEDDVNLGIQWACDQVPLATVVTTWQQAPDATSLSEYAPPEGFILDEVKHLQTGHRKLTARSPAELFEFDTGWLARTGTPIHYIPNYRRNASDESQLIWVYPTPTAVLTDLVGEFVQQAPWIASGDDGARLLIPQPYRIAAAAWALHLGFAADKQETYDLEKAQFWEQKAIAALKRLKEKSGRQFDGGPQTSTPQW